MGSAVLAGPRADLFDHGRDVAGQSGRPLSNILQQLLPPNCRHWFLKVIANIIRQIDGSAAIKATATADRRSQRGPMRRSKTHQVGLNLSLGDATRF
ncbi:hypothetical protein D3C72_1774330 [compost metagenome]